MFETLLASDARSDRQAIPAASAAGVHLLILATAVAASRNGSPTAIPVAPVSAVFFLPASVPARAAPGRQGAPIPAAPSPIKVATPADISLPGIPMIIPGIGVAGATINGPFGVGAPGFPGARVTTLSISPSVSGSEVEEAASVLVPGQLRYPPGLEAAGLTGRVELEFVVDTAGQVEPASIAVLTSTAEAFVLAARAAVLDTRFRPARAHGMHVRQLVRQSLAFVLPRR